jgi:peptide chain release factor 2
MSQRSYLENGLAAVNKLQGDLASCCELIEMAEAENDLDTLAAAELELKNIQAFAKEKEIECLFGGEADKNHAFLEIHAGAGGTESHDWASMLYRMYTRWAERHNFKIEIIDYLDGEEAGIKYVTMKIFGADVYGWLKTESGVHRLVRISPFNSAGKRHTSFASVWVYPVVDSNFDIVINESELRIDTYRSSGAGGQHVNTTDSAVRITHLPTKIVVQSQNNRSQHRNKEECMAMLKSKLYELELQKKADALNKENAAKTEIGWGRQIRSYVLHPYQMVKDLRTGHVQNNSSEVLDGELDLYMLKSLERLVSGAGLANQFQDDEE